MISLLMTGTTGRPGVASHTLTLGAGGLKRNKPFTTDDEEIVGSPKIDVVSGWAIRVEWVDVNEYTAVSHTFVTRIIIKEIEIHLNVADIVVLFNIV
jgi:hypothetical protein